MYGAWDILHFSRYTDAAKYSRRNAYAVSVVDSRGRELASATVKAHNSEAAEEAAIALATTTCTDAAVIFTDSQAACRNYAKGRISADALNIIKRRSTPLPYTCIIWVPGHEGLQGNEAAHAAAREHVSRAVLDPQDTRPMAEEVEAVQNTYSSLLQHYRLERRVYPPPHPKLTKEESVIIRRLQSNTHIHGILMHRLYPTKHSFMCPLCSVPDTLAHLLLECPCHVDLNMQPETDVNPALNTNDDHLTETWEAKLALEDLEDQRQLVIRAKRAVEARGFLD